DLFHQIRIAGNQAAHDHCEDHTVALTTLKVARELSVWFHRAFGKQPSFKPGAFIPPPPPEDATAPLREELDRLRTELSARQKAEERARAEAEEERHARETAEQRAGREADERAVWERLAQEAEDAKLALAAELTALQTTAEKTPAPEKAATLRD